MSIRLHSTVESVSKGDITVLAIVEMVLAIIITVFIAVYYETLIHIAISACIAPLLLLRTSKSTERGLRWFQTGFGIIIKPLLDFLVWIEPKWAAINDAVASDAIFTSFSRFFTKLLAGFLVSTILAGLTIILSLIIKIASATYTFVRNPIYSIGTIPDNWKRVAVCTDVVYPPELFPGWEEQPQDKRESLVSFPWFFNRLRCIYEAQQFSELIAFILFWWMPVAAIVFASMYRWSLKSTSLIYAPFVWVLYSTKSVRKSLYDYLLFAGKSAFGKLVFIYSFLMVLISLFKLYLFIWAQNLLVSFNETPGWSVFAIYLAPRQLDNVGLVVDFWHVTAFLSAVLAISMYFYSDLILLRIKEQKQWSEKTAIAIIGSSVFLQRFLSIYTITCVVYVTITAIPQDVWHQYSLRFLPW